MLPRDSRLRRSADIQAVLRRGQRITTPAVRLYVLPRVTGRVSRAACVVGRSVSRSAVRRHRYQRWLRVLAGEVLRQYFSDRPHDTVWIAQPAIIQCDSLASLREQVEAQLVRLRRRS